MKTAREFALAALNAVATDEKTGKECVVKDAMIKKLIGKAISEVDLNAIKYLLELIGESPVDVDNNEPPKTLTKEEVKELWNKLDNEY